MTLNNPGHPIYPLLRLGMVLGTLTITARALATVPHETVLHDSADLIEVNAYFDEDGRAVFTQLIFYDWTDGAYRVFAWRMVKHPRCVPVYDAARGCYVSLMREGELIRQVTAPSVRWTWTQHDPEVADRQFLGKCQRRGFALRGIE